MERRNINVETDRLFLRELDFSDDQDLFEMDSDPEVHRYIFRNPVQTISEIKEVIGMIRKQYHDFGTGRWAVLKKDTGEFLGCCGLKFYNTYANRYKDFYELGYRFKRRHWGQGYATESSRAVVDFGFRNFAIDSIFAMTDPENENSKKVLYNLGFEHKDSFVDDDEPTDWFELSRKSWLI